MDIENLIQSFESADIKEFDRFFIKLGLSLTRIHRQDNDGNNVEAGEEIIAIYTWKPGVSQNSFNYIGFTKWREHNEYNLLDIQLNSEAVYRQWMNELISHKDFKRSYLRRKDGKATRFAHVKSKINFQFMHRESINLAIPDFHTYSIIMIHNHYQYKK